MSYTRLSPGVGALSLNDTFNTMPSSQPQIGEMYLDLSTDEACVYDGIKWCRFPNPTSRKPKVPAQRRQGDLLWVSDLHVDERERVLQAGTEVGLNMIWVDEVADQNELDTDPDAKFYGSLWSYERDLGKFWKRYWELKGE